MRKKIAILVTWGTVFSYDFSIAQQDDVIQIADAARQIPIAGARVYVQDRAYALRSDVNGRVSIPKQFSKAKLSIRAKNYKPREVSLPLKSASAIFLEFDEALINPEETKLSFTRGDTLRGSYGPHRANNDLLFYDLNIELNVVEKHLSGFNTIRFKMLHDDARIQIDLFDNMQIDSILFNNNKLKYTREFNAVFVEFPQTLKSGQTYSINFYYSGHPKETGRFGGIAFKQDSLGNPWIYTACQNIGASLWWPNKDQQPDEVDSMRINIAAPSDLTVISNGRFQSKVDLGDGYSRWHWKVHYPINNYCVSLNIAKYTHFSEQLGDLTMDYYVLPYHLEPAKRQFSQASPMLECFEKYFGPYPFPKDGYKLIEVPYSGMEHQSAVTYGNLFQNGYLARDWTGVGVSTKFDFIIIHESGHEWFGNSVTANDISDAWIQEGWCTYAEGVYVECLFGYEDAIKYYNGYKNKVQNKEPIVGPTGVNHWPTGDQYFKGALFLHTLRHVVDDDQKWWAMLRDYAERFKYKNIYTAEVINFFNAYFKRDFSPIFEQYLYHASMPVLQVKFEANRASFRWKTEVAEFNMPLKVNVSGKTHVIHPTSQWKSETLAGVSKDNWKVATDLYYVDVEEHLQ
ncbi:MAG: M1 family metallopeptidase [bacterium]